ncbi:C45 family autoproteolytic acyltransferase/hydolase [Comamonas humi]
MPIHIHFRAIAEDQPGEKWKALCDQAWPYYRAWFLRQGAVARASFLECRRALRQHMPELVPTWERLVELAGGGDIEARFLSLWNPPPYITGCSQAVWLDPGGQHEPMLLRNYDFAPALLEGSWLSTRWSGQRVVAMGDCLWGALDGMNESGLAASLSFGGRTVCGDGFGIPLVLRYVLEVAQDTASAVSILQRVPVHMCYSVTLLDAQGDWATVFLNPDRPVEVTRHRAITNFQHSVEWPAHAQATSACERLAALQAQLGTGAPASAAVGAMLREPLFQPAWLRGYGTLYTAAYAPQSGRMELHWPGQSWPQAVKAFEEGCREIVYANTPPSHPHG